VVGTGGSIAGSSNIGLARRTLPRYAPMKNGETDMKKSIAFVAVCVWSFSTHASTKYIECSQTNEGGSVLIINATIDDASDKAEVQIYATTADCAKKQACGIDLYQKEVLPTVIRLTSVTFAGPISFKRTIDIDRTNLHFVTREVFKSPDYHDEKTREGTCKVKVDESKKLL
jgi:hypothetical protein